MDYFTKNKLLFWIVLILIILNGSTLTALWIGRPSQGGHDGQVIMEERLGLSDEQAQEFEQVRNEHFFRTEPIQNKIHEIHLKLLDEIFQPQPDPAKIQEMAAKIGRYQEQFEVLLFEHFSDLKQVCDESQTFELKFILAELIERTRHKPPRHREADPDGPQGPPPPPPPR